VAPLTSSAAVAHSADAMPRWFNIAGPCRPAHHYTLPVTRRLPRVRGLVEHQSYFVLHAPRQVGKTTSLDALARELTAEGRFAAALLSMEVGAVFPADTGAAELAILSAWRGGAESRLPAELQPPPWPEEPPGARIGAALKAWARACPRPLVLFLDEVDALSGPTLVSILRQLRDGYPLRPEAFPWSLVLVGLRDVRDYKAAPAGSEADLAGAYLGTASPFNIKDRSLTLRNFTAEEVVELYAQHTAEAGQVFTEDACARAFTLTQGQPWLVNALAKEAVEELAPEPTQAVTAATIDAAKEALLRRQETHLDSLAERLRESRVRRIIEPILAGTLLPDVPDDDLRYVIDLGLVRYADEGGLEIANPIYREVIPRSLARVAYASLPATRPTWLTPEGRLDPERLLGAFLAFWRQHGEPLLRAAPYHEIAPHLVLMAFLHRVANGGGTLEREYAIGSGRMDLLLTCRGDRLAIELKVWRDGDADPRPEGLAQLDRYLDGLGLDTGWLVLFDRRSGQPRIAQRTTSELTSTPSGRSVVVVRA
jgi:DNA polymerase III delta prime subunit